MTYHFAKQAIVAGGPIDPRLKLVTWCDKTSTELPDGDAVVFTWDEFDCALCLEGHETNRQGRCKAGQHVVDRAKLVQCVCGERSVETREHLEAKAAADLEAKIAAEKARGG